VIPEPFYEHKFEFSCFLVKNANIVLYRLFYCHLLDVWKNISQRIAEVSFACSSHLLAFVIVKSEHEMICALSSFMYIQSQLYFFA
jgi:hypothetical protein